MFKRICACLVTSIATLPVLSATNGENWEVSTQIAQGNNPLGPAKVMKLCFATDKNMKEPPPPPDTSCKTSTQQSGKKVAFKSVCKYDGMTMTSSGYTEEVSSTHFHTDLTIVTEDNGNRSQQRQVGDIKKIGGSCDPNDMSGFMKGSSAPQTVGSNPPAPAKKTPAKNLTSKTQSTSGTVSEEDTKPTQETTSRSSDSQDGSSSMIQVGTSIIKGLLPF
ncbi:MAG: DUF3617 family protein [Rhodocyclaceae bacterium]|nr:DUF3617 family protein [Rhodocyclaceae bacterium]